MIPTEFSVRLDEMMIIFILEFMKSDCTILSGLVSHFQKGITLGCLLLILQVKRRFNIQEYEVLHTKILIYLLLAMSYFVRTFFISCPISLNFFLVTPNYIYLNSGGEQTW